ncbi:MAG: hypothetical protein KF762_17290 [Acidobacteria bacterium]|nr:hypothetical protein [Acidobacteriota bacterium]
MAPNNPAYRAWGGLKSLSYGNGTSMTVGFDSRLQATAFEVKKDTTTLISKQYDFNADGSLKFVDDMLNATFDRSYKYDQMGRTVEAKAGTAARGETPTGPHNLDQPYSRQYSHNAFGQITSFNGFFYGSQSDYNVSFTNGRNPQWTYDADGNVLADIDGSFEFDAAGRLVKTTATDVDDEQVFLAPTEDHFDGNGQVAKRVRNAGSTDPAEIVNYFISSSVLGRVVSETNARGNEPAEFSTRAQIRGKKDPQGISLYPACSTARRFQRPTKRAGNLKRTCLQADGWLPGSWYTMGL